MGRRLQRVNEAVREVLSATLAAGLKDPRVGFVTVTGVEVTPDLRQAKVFVSVLGGGREREATLAGLRSSHGFLQERVAAELRLKRTPQLEFVYDDTLDRALRITSLIDRYEGELGPRPDDEDEVRAVSADETVEEGDIPSSEGEAKVGEG